MLDSAMQPHFGDSIETVSEPKEPIWLFDPWGWGPAIISAVVAVLLAISFHFVSQARGGFMLSLDEGYIHTVLAMNLADTGVLGLNPGQEGGGSSSPVWTLFMTLLTWIGVRPDIGAVFLSVVSLGLAVAFTVRYAFAMLKPTGAWIVAGIVVFLGQDAAMALTGLEAMLIAAFVILALYFHGQGWSKRSTASFVAGSLIRPEVVFAAFTAWLADLYNAVTGKHRFKNWYRAMEKPTERFIQIFVVFLAGLAVISMLAGTPPTALTGRRWLYGLGTQLYTMQSGAEFTFLHYLKSLAERLHSFIGPGGTVGWIWAIVVFALFVVGWVRLMVGDRSTGRATGMYLLLTPFFVGIVIGHEGHMSRYLAAFWLLMPIVVLLGWNFLFGLLPEGGFRKVVSVALAALLLAGLVPQIWRWGGWHADAVDHLRKVQLKMAYVVLERVPRTEPVAAFDIGVLAYRSRHQIVDLRGITDHQMASAMLKGRIPELLRQRGVKYAIIPESPNKATRYDLVKRLGFDPTKLKAIRTVSPVNGPQPYLKATQVARTKLTLYRLPD